MVMDFARKMESRLENDRIRSLASAWEEQTPAALLEMLRVSSDEIGKAIDERDSFADIRERCADVSNLAMMIARAVEKQ